MCPTAGLLEGTTMTDYQDVHAMLLGPRYSAWSIPRSERSGVYAFFLTSSTTFCGIRLHASGLLYVGMTESSLDVRNHFTHERSGFSSLRRTLGAVLKQQLGLQAIPRGPGCSKTNIDNYRFSDSGERKLSKWMNEVRCISKGCNPLRIGF
jgi:hypothetical protein